MSVSAWLSKQGRQELAGIVVSVIAKTEKHHAVPVLAGELGVRTQTVNRWLAGGIQGNNENVDNLVKIGLQRAPEETRKVLMGDFERHGLAVKQVLEVEQGGVQGCENFGNIAECKEPCAEAVECRALSKAFGRED